MTIIVAMSLISWAVLLTLVATADTEDRRAAAALLFILLVVFHLGFQWGAAWQRGYFDAKPANSVPENQKP